MKTLKAGKYYIGDCCYVLREEHGYDWGEFCEQFFDDEEDIVVNKKEIVCYSTAWGDGYYESTIGFNFPVDAGMIGVTPVELWKGKDHPNGCILVDFKNDFTCNKNGGTLIFGHIEIDTDPQYDEDDY